MLDHAKNVGDGIAVTGVVAGILAWIPTWSLIVTALYLTFRLWEMKTTQQLVTWLRRKLSRKH